MPKVIGINKVFTLPAEKRPFWAQVIVNMKNDGIELKSVTIAKDGKLLSEVYDVLDTIAKYNMILATGHLPPEECVLLTKAAHERKVEQGCFTEDEVRKAIVNNPKALLGD